MKNYHCNEITENILNQEIKLSGWVAKRRDHGGIIFVDLRDYTGIVQLVFNPEDKELFMKAESIRSEFVIAGAPRYHFQSARPLPKVPWWTTRGQ